MPAKKTTMMMMTPTATMEMTLPQPNQRAAQGADGAIVAMLPMTMMKIQVI
jgi:hypothetical protein